MVSQVCKFCLSKVSEKCWDVGFFLRTPFGISSVFRTGTAQDNQILFRGDSRCLFTDAGAKAAR